MAPDVLPFRRRRFDVGHLTMKRAPVYSATARPAIAPTAAEKAAAAAAPAEASMAPRARPAWHRRHAATLRLSLALLLGMALASALLLHYGPPGTRAR